MVKRKTRGAGGFFVLATAGVSFIEYAMVAGFLALGAGGGAAYLSQGFDCRARGIGGAISGLVADCAAAQNTELVQVSGPGSVDNTGPNAIGSCSTPFTIRNDGTAASEPLAVTVSGDYRIGSCSNTCSGQSLASGGSCSVSLQAVSPSNGALSGTVTFRPGTGGSLSIPVDGTASGIEQSDLVYVSGPDPVNHVGPVTPGACSSPFTFRNDGGASTDPLVVTVSGDYEASGCPNLCQGRALGAGDTCTVRVRSTAAFDGDLSGSIIVEAGSLAAMAPINGTATNMPEYRWVTGAYGVCSGDAPWTLGSWDTCSGEGNWSPDPWGACSGDTTWSAGAWGVCSETCGGGVQTRSVACNAASGTRSRAVACTGAPGTQSRTANCPATNGTQTRDVTCQDVNSTVVDDDLCRDAGQGERPIEEIDCSGSCGTQPDTTQACTGGCDPASEPPASEACEGICSGATPPESQACNTALCAPSQLQHSAGSTTIDHQGPTTPTDCAPALTITNIGGEQTSPLSWTVGGSYQKGGCTDTCTGTRLAASEACQVAVQSRASSNGGMSGTVTVSGAATPLTIALSGTAFDFEERWTRFSCPGTTISTTTYTTLADCVDFANVEGATCAQVDRAPGTCRVTDGASLSACGESCTTNDTVSTLVTPGILEADPTSISLGQDGKPSDQVCQATPTTFTNIGDSATGVISVSLSGPYVLTGCTNTCAGANLQPGQSCAVALRPAATVSGAMAGTLQIIGAGGGGAVIPVTGTATNVDVVPDVFDFTDLINQPFSSEVLSEIVTPSGYDAPTYLAVSGDGAPQMSIDGGDWAASGWIGPGETLQIKVETSPLYEASRTVSMTVAQGDVDTFSVDWIVSTRPEGCAPGTSAGGGICVMPLSDSKELIAYTSDAPSLAWGSHGITRGVYGTTDGYANTELLSGSGAAAHPAAHHCWSLNQNGFTDWYLPAIDQLRELNGIKGLVSGLASSRYWSSSERAYAGTAWALNFNTDVVEDDYKHSANLFRCMRTNDRNDDVPELSPNDFTDTGAGPGVTATSNSITLLNFHGPLTASVTGDGSPQISKNDDGNWASSVSVSAGDTIAVRLTAAATENTERTATVTIGTGALDWTVTSRLQGYIVMTAISRAGNIGGGSYMGLSGANKLCAEQVIGNGNWLGKTTASANGILTGQHIQAALCDSARCQLAVPGAKYNFARSQAPGEGGAVNEVNESGFLVSDGNNWSSSSYFGINVTYWTGSNGSSGFLSDRNATCSNWNIASSSNVGDVGGSGYSDSRRFRIDSYDCSNPRRLLCWVHPNTSLADITPDAVSITEVSAGPGSLATSEVITLQNFDGDIDISVSGTQDARLRVNGGSWVTSASVQHGDVVELQDRAPVTLGDTFNVAFSYGGLEATWSITAANLGYLVMKPSLEDGGLGRGYGLHGANKQCAEQIINSGDWNGKAEAAAAGILVADNIMAALCDQTTCQRGVGDTQYTFARSQNPSWGGASYQTDAAGVLQSGSEYWNTSDTFGADNQFWTGASSSHGFLEQPAGSSCNNWSTGNGAVNGVQGRTIYNDYRRWYEGNQNCNVNRAVLCWVHPNASLADKIAETVTFSDVTVATGELGTSSQATLYNFDGTLSVSVAGTSEARLKVNSGSWVTSATVTNGDTITMRERASSTDYEERQVTLTYGTQSATWTLEAAPCVAGNQVFTSSATWTVPSTAKGCSTVRALVVPNGSGGMTHEGPGGCTGRISSIVTTGSALLDTHTIVVPNANATQRAWTGGCTGGLEASIQSILSSSGHLSGTGRCGGGLPGRQCDPIPSSNADYDLSIFTQRTVQPGSNGSDGFSCCSSSGGGAGSGGIEISGVATPSGGAGQGGVTGAGTGGTGWGAGGGGGGYSFRTGGTGAPGVVYIEWE